MALIALVDPNTAFRYAVARVLRAAGHTVLEFGTAAAYLQAFETIEIVVADARVHDMDIVVFCRQLKRGQQPPAVVIISEVPLSDDVRREVQGACGDAFFEKSGDLSALVAVVDRALASHPENGGDASSCDRPPNASNEGRPSVLPFPE